VGWDEPLSEAHARTWGAWLESLKHLCEVKIARQFFAGTPDLPSKTQLHVFCDASRIGYGVVVYLRAEIDGRVELAFVAGKARVAPVKQLQTIPKLELTAATTAVRLARFVLHEMSLKLPVIYHSDSQVVLSFVKSEDRRFPVFVANRVQLIREFSDPSDWRYVPSSLNPADQASRGLNAADIANSEWLSGPKFLLTDEAQWPLMQPIDASKIVEVGQVQLNAIEVKESGPEVKSPSDRLIEHYSSWGRLRRAVVYYRKFAQWLYARGQSLHWFRMQQISALRNPRSLRTFRIECFCTSMSCSP
jgi:hypothetical protein